MVTGFGMMTGVLVAIFHFYLCIRLENILSFEFPCLLSHSIVITTHLLSYSEFMLHTNICTLKCQQTLLII